MQPLEETTDSEDWDFSGHDVEGTIAILHEDIVAYCELGRSGVATVIGLGVCWPFILLIQAPFLNSKANKLEADFENAKKRAAVATPVIEVNDKHNHEEEDATPVDESLEKDEIF
jgi:hypothetical protein